MRCIVCDNIDLEHPMIVHYYEDYGKLVLQTETYCSFRCLRQAII